MWLNLVSLPGDLSARLGAVILAGGAGTRLPDKCFRTVGGKYLVMHAFERVQRVTQEVVVTTKTTEQANRLSNLLPTARIVLDDTETCCPLVGLLSGLRAIKTPYVLALPCDAPFIRLGVIRMLFERALEHDGAVPVDDGKLEPLCAIYQRLKAIRAAERTIADKHMSLHDMLAQLGALVQVPKEDLRKADPCLFTFLNINTDSDLALAERIAAVDCHIE